jgi:DcuC family C4-dicarboxylate transporter
VPPALLLILGCLIIGGAIYAIVRQVDVRLALLAAALLLGLAAGNLPAIATKFATTFVGETYVVPICTAMGFAYVLKHTGCDRHLVHLLVNPLRRVRALLIPGAVVAGFLVNIPIISQTSTAVAIGSVLIPLLRAAGISPLTAGSALLLGASIGGELFNPGAPEFRTVIREIGRLGLTPPEGAGMVRGIVGLNLLHLAVATTVFWALSVPAEARWRAEQGDAAAELPEGTSDQFRVNAFKAAVPLLPLALLFLTAPPFEVVRIPREWLVGPGEASTVLRGLSEQLGDPRLRDAAPSPFDSRLIGAAMMIGVIVAAFTDRRQALTSVNAFFEGAGYAFANVISLIVAATCFGEGVKLIGLDAVVQGLIGAAPGLLLPAAGFLTLAFAFICGSGIAATQSLFHFFAEPSVAAGVAPQHTGAVVALGAAAGRTMSPVAAVTLMCGRLTETRPADLVRRVAPPLLAGMTAVVIAGMILSATGVWSPPPARISF